MLLKSITDICVIIVESTVTAPTVTSTQSDSSEAELKLVKL